MSPRFLLAISLIALLGCPPSEGPDEPPDPPRPEAPPLEAEGDPVVEQRVDRSVGSACPERVTCLEPWRTFANAVSPGRPRLVTGTVESRLAFAAEQPFPGPMEPAEIRFEAIEGSGVRRSLDDLDSRPLAVVVRDEAVQGGLTHQALRFEDDWTGPFDAVLIRPSGDGPVRAVIGYPDRGEGLEEFLVARHGDSLVAAGFAVLVIRPRADGADATEDLASPSLPCQPRTRWCRCR